MSSPQRTVAHQGSVACPNSTSLHGPSEKALSSPYCNSRVYLHFVVTLFALAFLVGCGGKKADSVSENDDRSNASLTEVDNTSLDDLPALFEEVSIEVGLDSSLQFGDLEDYFFPDIMCGGSAFFDANNDDRLDVLLIGAGENRSMSRPSDSATSGRNRFFRQTPEGTFVDATDESGLGDDGYGMGVATGDVNNDGYVDVYVSCYGPDRLYLNRGDGTFIDVTESADIDNPHWSASVIMCDLNRDGWLDIFVTNYVDYHASNQCFRPGEIPDYCSPQQFNPVPDRIFLNQGPSDETGGEASIVRFVEISVAAGIADHPAPGLGVVAFDANQDGWVDIYVANDGTVNQLWINQGNQTFVDEAAFRGVASDLRGRPQAGMGVAIGDINGDGPLDLVVTHLDQETNAIYVGKNSGGFSESSSSLGFANPSLPYTGFGTAIFDIENDGDLDVVWVNGRVTARSDSEQEPFWDRYRERNQMMIREQDGQFVAYSSRNDPFTKESNVSRSLARGDFDNDGRIDMLVTNADSEIRLYRNQTTNENNWIGFRVVANGRYDLGATVQLEADGMMVSAIVQTGGSYCSASDPRVFFGLGQESAISEIEVRWANGNIERFSNLEMNAYNLIEYGNGSISE